MKNNNKTYMKNDEIKYSRNITINYLFIVLKNLDLTHGIWMLYLVSKGMTLFQVGLLEGIFHVTSFLMETPTGVVADLYGRKWSRIIGAIFTAISSIILLMATNFWMCAIAFIVTAFSYNFESGSAEALVYDSLLLDKKESKFMKITGNIEVIYQSIGVISLLVGGIIGTFSYEMIYYINIIISIVTSLCGLLFIEPIIGKKEKITIKKAIKKQYKDSFYVLKNGQYLVYLIIFTGIISTIITLSFYYLQLGWKNINYSEWQIGLFLAVSSITGAIGGILAVKIEKKLGEKVILKYSPFIVLIALISFYNIKFSFIGLSLISFIDSILFVCTRDYINKLIPSEKRATILSFESMVFSFFMVCLFPIFGKISDVISMKFSFLILSVVLLILIIINLKHWKISKVNSKLGL